MYTEIEIHPHVDHELVVLTEDVGSHYIYSLTNCSFCFFSCRARFHSGMVAAGTDSDPLALLGRAIALVTEVLTNGDGAVERQNDKRIYLVITAFQHYKTTLIKQISGK